MSEDRPLSDGDHQILRAVLDRVRPSLLEKLGALREAQAAGFAGGHLAQAQDHAHKLAGSLGTYGMHEAGQAAQELEELLDGDTVGAEERDRAARLIDAIAVELEPT